MVNSISVPSIGLANLRMEDGKYVKLRKPRYEDEDTSPTTSRELKGFYVYSLAAEVFAVCGVGSFLPVTLEQLARENGVLWSDQTTPCVAKTSTRVAARVVAARAAASDTTQCVIPALGNMTTSSFALYTFSIAVFVQALALVSFSAVADHGLYRKKFLTAFGFCGSISSMLFIAVVPQAFLLAPLLVVIGVTCLGSSFVILNSFLPLLVANHPQVASDDLAEKDRSSIPPRVHSLDSGDRFSIDRSLDLTRQAANDEKDSVALKLSTQISSTGVGIGYAAAVFVQILSILLLFGMSKLSSVSSTLPLRLVLLLVGTWWLLFTIPSSMWLRDRPGPPLKKISDGNVLRSCFAYTLFAWGSVWKTVKIAVKLRQMVIFLIAWFLLIAIALLSITATASGIAGATLWPLISRRLELKTNRTIVACILAMELIPLYGLLGYVPLVKSWGVGGLQQAWEIYPLGFIHGFVMGGLSSYCRSLFGQLIPPGNEAAFYALYAITDKGSSALGPALVGLIVDATGSIRPAFAFLAILILLPLPLMMAVDAERGRADAAVLRRRRKKARRGIDADECLESRAAGTPVLEEEAEGLMRDHE
ncbi:uncharacterized protein L3040_001988 [Drepanopeziza brunnea f. sp. 'multigermtubi']|uniref:uncharacterized protein n=1 Tax=Drepanopeziza brunnea f. sp. 'multigermtubi' TaxID=698441 RepID=UPI0023A5749B|nr:hypothetical protein L3040_001988 [Drepanopeziza brunnea f. sp. 'multigermtubi']